MAKIKGRTSGMTLSHFNEHGAARMVDVSGKNNTVRAAVAGARVLMQPETLQMILECRVAKGDVFGVARIAGIMAAKRTSELIPMCHPLNLSSVEVEFAPDSDASCVNIRATAGIVGRTGVEMEALTAVAAAGLTIYDMCKSADRSMVVTDIRLLKKSGGASGTFVRKRESRK